MGKRWKWRARRALLWSGFVTFIVIAAPIDILIGLVVYGWLAVKVSFSNTWEQVAYAYRTDIAWTRNSPEAVLHQTRLEARREFCESRINVRPAPSKEAERD